MSRKWTEEEHAALKLYAEEGMHKKDAYNEFTNTGYERSYNAFNKKYTLAMVAVSSEIVEVVSEPKEEKETDWVIVTALTIAAIIIGFWWSTQ
jgi:adenine-specific DNA methylase